MTTAAVCALIMALLLMAVFFSSKPLYRRLTALTDSVKSGCTPYEAVVLDVHKEKLKARSGAVINTKVCILQFRCEEKHSTIVHKYTLPFSKKYKRGDKVTLYFRESPNGDIALIDGDCPYDSFARLLLRIRPLALGEAMLFACAGVLILLH